AASTPPPGPGAGPPRSSVSTPSPTPPARQAAQMARAARRLSPRRTRQRRAGAVRSDRAAARLEVTGPSAATSGTARPTAEPAGGSGAGRAPAGRAAPGSLVDEASGMAILPSGRGTGDAHRSHLDTVSGQSATAPPGAGPAPP